MGKVKAAITLFLECLECGHKFRSRSQEPRCPKCHGYDVEVA